MWFKKNKGLKDNQSTHRVGLMYLKIDTSYQLYVKTRDSYNIVAEVIEVYQDKELSKVEITKLYNYSKKRFRKNLFETWQKSSSIYWLCPPTDVDRDNKINDILK